MIPVVQVDAGLTLNDYVDVRPVVQVDTGLTLDDYVNVRPVVQVDTGLTLDDCVNVRPLASDTLRHRHAGPLHAGHHTSYSNFIHQQKS